MGIGTGMLTGDFIGMIGAAVVSTGLVVVVVVVVGVSVIGGVVGAVVVVIATNDGSDDGSIMNTGDVNGLLLVGIMGDMVPQLVLHPNTSAMQSPNSFPVRSQVGQQSRMVQTEFKLSQDVKTTLVVSESSLVQSVEQRVVLPVVPS